MMKFLRILLTSLAAILCLYVIASFFMPADIEITRSKSLNMPVHRAFANVADFSLWEKWNPWAMMDKNISYSFSDETYGIGSVFTWSSQNPDVGIITRKIYDLIPGKSISISLIAYDRPKSIETWSFASSDNNTNITWTIKTRLSFFFRLLAPVIDLKIGSVMQQGLDNMSPYSSVDVPVNLKIIQETLPDQMYIVKRGNAPHNDPAAISDALRNAYTEVRNFASYFNLIITGPPVALNIEWGDTYVFDAGFPVAQVRLPESAAAVKFINIQGGLVVKGIYTGPYDKMAPAYNKIEKFIASNNLKIDGFSWEEYISVPKYTSRDSLITHIYFPVR